MLFGGGGEGSIILIEQLEDMSNVVEIMRLAYLQIILLR